MRFAVLLIVKQVLEQLVPKGWGLAATESSSMRWLDRWAAE